MPTWMNYKGHKIVYLDFRGLPEDEVVAQVAAFEKMVLDLSAAEVDNILFLVNFEKQYATPAISNAISATAKKIHRYIAKGAIVGELSLTKRVLMSVYTAITGGNRKVFDDEQSAKEWLITG
ncbi:MAG: hypothetical protein GY854_24845 [Deltaproteobacteria bacterium]|nr:hypothetical protein [Deltaproteobacteria bacterium]